jgi:hypothetical protein
MDTNHPAASRTGPPFLFVSYEMSYAELFYVREIVNHTHAILGSIPFIQVVQPVARKPVAAEAVPDFTLSYLLTIFDSARNAGFRFEPVVTPATGTCLLISCIRATEATVHPAGSDQSLRDRICLCRSSWRHICIPSKPCMGGSVLEPNAAVIVRHCFLLLRCSWLYRKHITCLPFVMFRS